MRDCPACRVPLHGYEEVCPSCGTKQHPTKSSRGPYGTNFKPEEAKINWVPFIVVGLGFVVFFVMAMQSTWLGQVMRGENKVPDDPMAKWTYVDARNTIESELNKNLQAVGASNTKMTWKSNAGGADPNAPEADARAVDGPVELTVATKLPNKELRKQVIDPIKPYMEKGKVYSLTMTDSASHATWTYNLQQTTSPENPNAGFE